MESVEKNEKTVTLLKPAPVEAATTTNHVKTEQQRTCKAPNCKTVLRPDNKSGYCSKHFHLSRDRKAKKANGHANGQANGKSVIVHASSLHADLREDRLNRLLLSFPLEDKSRIAAAWLEGRI